MADQQNEAELASLKNECPENKNVVDPGSSKEDDNKVKQIRIETEQEAQNQNTLFTIKDKIKDHFNVILLGIAIFGVILSIVGLSLPKIKHATFENYEIVKDYTDCTIYDHSLENFTKCKDFKKNISSSPSSLKSFECNCSIELEIKTAMSAPVTAYYELDDYDQIVSHYSQSRDDNQLAGNLSLEPSESCGSHTYACPDTAVREPIAPCGRLADAMFTDLFSIQIDNEYVNTIRYGLISEDNKKQFRNPETPGTLEQAFSNFSRPMSWTRNVWELDIANPDNNGFQNEQFIIWMKTDQKRKPAWRVNHTGTYEKGLPAGNYTLKVTYAYPTPRFGGRRKFILRSSDGDEVVKDYTDCTKFRNDGLKCRDDLDATGVPCYCYNIELEIRKLMTEPVTAYYELDAYNQIKSYYSKSRDDNQLAGNLSLEPSESCGSHTYACISKTNGLPEPMASRKPIAPCGLLADAMFNDVFNLEANNETVTYIRHGLISEDEKKLFHNPKSEGTLSEAFRNFSKPMSWSKNVWELDDENPENNGFQNEQFIIWMKTDQKRKPAWRVNHTGKYEKGLPAGNYTLNVTYGNLLPRFDGRRKFILSSKKKIETLKPNVIGIALLVIGMICFIAASCLLAFKHRSVIISLFQKRE